MSSSTKLSKSNKKTSNAKLSKNKKEDDTSYHYEVPYCSADYYLDQDVEQEMNDQSWLREEEHYLKELAQIAFIEDLCEQIYIEANDDKYDVTLDDIYEGVDIYDVYDVDYFNKF